MSKGDIDMAYAIEYKEQIIKRLQQESVAKIAQETGISKPTLYNWKKQKKESKEKNECQETLEQKDTTKKEEMREDYFFRMGTIFYRRKKDKEQAMHYFLKSIQRQERSYIKSILFVGKIYEEMGNYEEARKQFEQYIEIDKDEHPHPHLELGRLEVLEGNYEEARKQFNKYIEIDKDRTAYAYSELAKLSVLEGNYQEAQRQFEKCLKICPKYRYAKQELKELQANKSLLNNNNFQESKPTTITQENKDLFNRIRAKINQETIEMADIQLIKEQEKGLSPKDYYLLQIVICEKLGQRQRALELIRQMETDGLSSKELTKIKERIRSKKAKIFDLASWDNILGWQSEKSKEEEERQRKLYEKHSIKKRPKEVVESEQSREERKPSSLKPSKKHAKQEVIWKTSKEGIVGVQREKAKKQQKGKDGNPTEKKEKITIAEGMHPIMQEAIKKINLHYYVKMQPTNNDVAVQNKYIKKYDKLQSILECSSTNKRAQMELMLVLMNEGYGEVVEKSFPQEDISFVQNLVEQCKQKKLVVEEARKQIDEYCL